MLRNFETYLPHSAQFLTVVKKFEYKWSLLILSNFLYNFSCNYFKIGAFDLHNTCLNHFIIFNFIIISTIEIIIIKYHTFKEKLFFQHHTFKTLKNVATLSIYIFHKIIYFFETNFFLLMYIFFLTQIHVSQHL